MIAIDTNVLVRLLINDDMQHAAKAKQLFDANADEDGSVWMRALAANATSAMRRECVPAGS